MNRGRACSFMIEMTYLYRRRILLLWKFVETVQMEWALQHVDVRHVRIHFLSFNSSVWIWRFWNDSCFIKNACKGRTRKSRLQEFLRSPATNVKFGSRNVCMDASIDYTSSFAPRNKLEYHYTFSWCTSTLLEAEKTPRRHCGICKRCRNHRHEHCNDCNRCCFAEGAGQVPRSCQVHPSGSHQIVKEAISFDHVAAFAKEENECTITWWAQCMDYFVNTFVCVH